MTVTAFARRLPALLVVGALAGAVTPGAGHAHDVPAADKSWWWDDAWLNQGRLRTPENHAVVSEQVSYVSRGTEIPSLLAMPADVSQGKRYPAVLFQHGRAGLSDDIQRHAKRVAARGFIVLAPDIYRAHFLSTHPVDHDYELEKDVAAGFDALLARPEVSTARACAYSHTRGGYYTLKSAVTHKRQDDVMACYVSYYPHLQDPNAPEALQVYSYAKEADDLRLPTLIFIGDQEQYQRRRVIETAIGAMKTLKRDATLVVYPGTGRAFDFRPDAVRTFADDLAAKDAIARAADFMRAHLAGYAKTR